MAGLLDPLEVKGLTFRNRIVMPPMQTGRATVKGAVTDRLVSFYVRRSTALGLLIVEHCYVSSSGKLSPKQLGIYDDELIGGLERLSGRIHAAGTPVVVQITHAGGVANREVIGAEPVGPSATGKTRELTRSEIEALVEDFAVAAERAIKAGFDGVELHGAHGFLLNQFFSPLLNKRGDEYGGSLENRMRFPLMVVEEVRKRVKGRLLLYRLGADDLAPNGTQIESSVAFAVKLEQRGVDVVDVSGGLCGSEPKQLRNVKGYFVPQAYEIKKAVRVPVVGVGGITEAEYADMLVRDGKVDLVAVGRAFWKDPKWAEKAVEALKA
ncbi:NADH:flavin oxidoreductase [Candidatus Bathyarchaeota archaeon]|nr:NADH:flavin oxidoreductase [Candidatus Bathyarchaeota archaeon]